MLCPTLLIQGVLYLVDILRFWLRGAPLIGIAFHIDHAAAHDIMTIINHRAAHAEIIAIRVNRQHIARAHRDLAYFVAGNLGGLILVIEIIRAHHAIDGLHRDFALKRAIFHGVRMPNLQRLLPQPENIRPKDIGEHRRLHHM